jgi:curved DNA-binding protein CbpA
MDARFLLPYSPERDVYRLLQVDPTAPPPEILAACRRLARAFHPDRNLSPRANEEMQVVNAVRQLMADPSARAAYDRERWRWWHAAAGQPRPVAARWPGSSPVGVREERRRRRSSFERYAYATWVGLCAALEELGPTRCGRCTNVIRPDDNFCATCGGRLLATSAA